MKRRKDKGKAVSVFFAVLIILVHLLFLLPTVYADDQIIASFDPKANEPPFKPINPNPANGSVDVPSSPTLLCVDVYDPSNITVKVFFYNAFNSSLIGIDYGVACRYDWSTASVNWNETERGSIYSWYAIVDDNQYQNTSDTFYFATLANQPPVISNPSPANGAQDVPITTPYWNATIEDPENDTVNWTIQTIHDIGSASGNTSNASCSISGLNYSTIYIIYVNATDTGSGQWTNETFWFETASLGAPTISNEYPPNRSTHIELQPTCQIDVQDLEGDNLTVYWYENSTGSWILRQTNNASSNATVSWIFSQASAYSTTYYWRVSVNDSVINTTAIFHFTTLPKPSPQSPGGGGYHPPPNKCPIANLTDLDIGYVNETVYFFAYYSYDTDGYITGYRWDFENDGLFDTDWLDDPFVTHIYTAAGNYTVKVQVKDDDGAKAIDTCVVSIIQLEPDKHPSFAQIEIISEEGMFVNKNISFDASGSYDPDGVIVTYQWDFGDGNTSTLVNLVHSYTQPGNYTVTLTVTDDDNLTSVTAVMVSILDDETVKPDERTQPLYLLIVLVMAVIAIVLALLLYFRGDESTSLSNKPDKYTKNTDRKIKPSLNRISRTSRKKTIKNIDAKVDKLLLKLDKIEKKK